MHGELNRRQTLALGLASSVASAAIASPAAPTLERSLIDDVRDYAAMGPHRTGSPGNLRALDWIEHRLTRIGFTVERQPVRFSDHDVQSARIDVAGSTIVGLAQYPVRPTGTEGLSLPLVLADDQAGRIDVKGRIAVIRLPHARHSSILEARNARPIRAALEAGAAGLVLVTRGPSAEALALNAPLEHPIGAVPALNVGPRDGAQLIAAAARGENAVLRINAQPIMASSYNLVARRPGQGRSIVVTTPLSGWFACAGERGSGVAAWLRMAEALIRLHPQADLWFAGFVGHEREYVGGARFMDEYAPPPDQVRLWIHVGAGFAARDWHEISDSQLLPLPSTDAQRYLLVPESWIDALKPSVGGLPGLETPYPATVANSAGEARHIMERGYDRLITNIGAHRYHHAMQDLPAMVDPVGLEATWRGWSDLVFNALNRFAVA